MFDYFENCYFLEIQGTKEDDMRKSLFSSAKSPTENGRPSSMVFKVRTIA